MKAFKFPVIVVLSLFLIGCGQQQAQADEEEKPYDKDYYQVNADHLDNPIDLKLSDLAENFRLVKLETNEDCIINASSYLVVDKYIVAFSHDGFYKFSSDGKFLKKILSYGRGPDEIVGIIFNYCYDGERDLLYLGDYNIRDKYLVYDMNSDQFLEPMRMAKENMENITIYNDTLLAGYTTFRDDDNNYHLIIQTNEGKLISDIIPRQKRALGSPYSEPLTQGISFVLANNDIRVKYIVDDTLFALRNNKIVPYIIVDFDTPQKDPPPSYHEVGDRRVGFPGIEPSSFYITTVSRTEKVVMRTPTAGTHDARRDYFLLNKYTGEWFNIISFENDFSGETQIPNVTTDHLGLMELPSFDNDDKLVVEYQPSKIKEIAEKNLNNGFSTPEFQQQLLEISKDLDEMDNPVLLIGDIKYRI